MEYVTPQTIIYTCQKTGLKVEAYGWRWNLKLNGERIAERITVHEEDTPEWWIENKIKDRLKATKEWKEKVEQQLITINEEVQMWEELNKKINQGPPNGTF